MSRDTYVKLHNIEKLRQTIHYQRYLLNENEKANIELEGIRFSSRNQQDSCVYRFEVSRGDVDFVDRSHKIESARYLRTYFNGYGYYNVKTSKVKIYLRPFNAYTMLFHETLEYGRIPLTGRYLVYELTKIQ